MSDVVLPIDPALFDKSVSPGEDFFRYANGGWLDANPVPPEYGSWGAFHEVTERNQELLHRLLQEAAQSEQPSGTPRRMVGDYFAAAMDEAAIAEAGATPLQPWLERIEAARELADIRDLARDMHRSGISPFHSLEIAADFEDSDAYLVYIGQGGLGLPERDYYLRADDHSVGLRDAYMRHISNQFGNLGGGVSEVTLDVAARILRVEIRLAEASYTAEQMRDVQLTMNRHSVESLDELMPQFGLREYANELGVTLPSVNIDNPGFFSALECVLLETEFDTLKDYLRWRLILAFASSLSPAFEEEAFDFYGRTLGGQQQMRPRWKRMLDAASSDIGEQVAQLYVEAAFSESAKRRCEQMVDHLLSAMGRAIEHAEWMTEATKKQAAEKLAGFTYKIGFPDEWRDYSKLEIGRTSFAENRMRAAVFEYDRQFSRLGQPVDEREWEMPAHQVNAYYHPLLNEVVFPAGILQPPFFWADADDAVNYGAIGAVIGHEITHGFDDRGRQFDAQGRLRDWWTAADAKEFDRRAEVLVKQFEAYEVLPDVHLNGRLTLGENIADLGGLTIALDALREAGGLDTPPIDGLTAEQRFFLSWAAVWHTNYTEEYQRLLANIDPHSPARERVNGPVANMPAFQTAFGLSDSAPLLRLAEKRAHIW
jgi:predicted metalloendopeptidase